MNRELAELSVLIFGLALIGLGLWLLFPADFEEVVEEYFAPVRDLWRGIWRD